VEYLEVCARTVKESTSSKLNAVKESSQIFSSCILELEEASRILGHRSKTTTRQIQETAKSLILNIQRQKEELIAQVENETKTLLERHMMEKAEWQDKLKKSKEFVSQAERLLERSTGAELVRSKTAIDEHFSELEPPGTPYSSWPIIIGDRMGHVFEERSTLANRSRIKNWKP